MNWWESNQAAQKMPSPNRSLVEWSESEETLEKGQSELSPRNCAHGRNSAFKETEADRFEHWRDCLKLSAEEAKSCARLEAQDCLQSWGVVRKSLNKQEESCAVSSAVVWLANYEKYAKLYEHRVYWRNSVTRLDAVLTLIRNYKKIGLAATTSYCTREKHKEALLLAYPEELRFDVIEAVAEALSLLEFSPDKLRFFSMI